MHFQFSHNREVVQPATTGAKLRIMIRNLRGKLRYIFYLLSSYQEGLLILLKIIFSKPITQLRLKNGLIIKGRKRSLLLEIVDEIFFQKVYTPGFLGIHRGDVVIDIGANIGVFSLYAAKEGAGKIYAIEPLPENIRAIKQNFHTNNITDVDVSRVAISDKTGEARFYLDGFDPHGLLFDRNAKRKLKKYIRVPTETLEHFLISRNIKRVDFLKVDCEGSEGKILASTPASVWKNIQRVALEFHDGISQLSHNDLIQKFKEMGYKTALAGNGPLLGYIYAWRTRR